MSDRFVLGVSGLFHDSAAAVLRNGEVVAAVQEERLSRTKNDPSFPQRAITHCLRAAAVPPDGLEVVAYYEKPMSSFDRVLKSFTAAGWSGVRGFPRAMDRTMRSNLWVGYQIERCLRSLGVAARRPVVYAEHHISHAAAAFYPSPFDHAAVLTFDGVGEWATSSIGTGRGNRIDLLQELRFPHSIGLLYSAFTVAAGFSVNSGEYKLMGLAPYGRPTYLDRILSEVVDLRDDGSFTLDLDHFAYLGGERMTSDLFDATFDGPPRDPQQPITRRECDLARSIQDVVEEIVLRMAAHAHERTGAADVVLGGGVALNCVANGRLLREGPFSNVWVQPAAGDAGSAMGCALWAWHELLGEPRAPHPTADGMNGSFLGPLPTIGDVSEELTGLGRPHEHLPDPEVRARRVARLLADGAVVGICRGPAEFGPRALGNRSILADPRSATMQATLNARTKRRESFRPFAPVVAEERVGRWFEFDRQSPYMSFVAQVRGATAAPPPAGGAPGDIADLADRQRSVRSPLPAVTHVDGSARLQTADAARHPELHRLLLAFEEVTGCAVLVNTSFNVRGEPIVTTAEDAYRCFMHTDIDWLLVGDCLLSKAEQPQWDGPPPDLGAD